MNKNDYVSAVGYFQKAVKGKYKECSIAYYYLANALWKRGRKDDALIAYGKSYYFDPTGQTAKHSVRVLRHYSSQVKRIAVKKGMTPKVKKVVKAAGINEASFKKEANKRNPEKPSGSLINQKKLDRIVSKLPDVNHQKPAHPDAPTFWTWGPGVQADYLPSVETRLERSRNSLNQAVENFRDAKRFAAQILPRHKRHGESNEHFTMRSKQQRDKYDELMQPYREEIASRTNYVNDLISMRNRAWLMWGQERDIPYIAAPPEAKKTKVR